MVFNFKNLLRFSVIHLFCYEIWTNVNLFLMGSMKPRLWKWNLATKEVFLILFYLFILNALSYSLVAPSLSHLDWDISQVCWRPYVQKRQKASGNGYSHLGLLTCFVSLVPVPIKEAEQMQRLPTGLAPKKELLLRLTAAEMAAASTVHTGI